MIEHMDLITWLVGANFLAGLGVVTLLWLLFLGIVVSIWRTKWR